MQSETATRKKIEEIDRLLRPKVTAILSRTDQLRGPEGGLGSLRYSNDMECYYLAVRELERKFGELLKLEPHADTWNPGRGDALVGGIRHDMHNVVGVAKAQLEFLIEEASATMGVVPASLSGLLAVLAELERAIEKVVVFDGLKVPAA